MPIHDWTRVDAGTLHAFHVAWIAQLMGALNAGVLTDGYYALAEQITTGLIPDVVTLRDQRPANGTTGNVGLAVAPLIRQRFRPASPARQKPPPRSIAVRRASGHEVVAIIEIVSASNKDRRDSVHEFAIKVESFLRSGIHVLLIDLLPPGKRDPRGMHAAVWARFDRKRYHPPASESLMLASYHWDDEHREPEAFVEPAAVGRALTAMPLFLSAQRFVDAPLEATYGAAFATLPGVHRTLLEAPA